MVHLNSRAWPEHTLGIDSKLSLSSKETSSSALFEDLQSLNSERISRSDHRDLKSRDHRSPRDQGQIDPPTSIISSVPSPRRSSRNAAARGPKPLLPRSLKEALQLAELLSKSKLIPKGFETPETCLVGILYGMEVGLSPIAALQRMAVIDGRPTIWGDAALALVQASGLLQSIEEEIVETEDSDNGKILTAICKVKREGRSEPTTGTFSNEDAKRAGLWQKPGPWTDYPKRMLTMRARAFALRDAFPDVLAGLYIREEFEGAERRYGQQKDEHEDPRIARVQVNTRSHFEERGQDDDVGKTNISRNVNTHCDIITAIGPTRRAPPPPPPPEEFGETIAELKLGHPAEISAVNLPVADQVQREPLDPETLIDLFDSALCCAFDSSTLEEIMDEFVERLSPHSRETQERAQKIIARHKNRVDELDPCFTSIYAKTADDAEPNGDEVEERQMHSNSCDEAEIERSRGLKARFPSLGLLSMRSLRRRRRRRSSQSRSLASWNARPRLQAFKFKAISPTDLEDREDRELEP